MSQSEGVGTIFSFVCLKEGLLTDQEYLLWGDSQCIFHHSGMIPRHQTSFHYLTQFLISHSRNLAGLTDPFLAEQLKPGLLKALCDERGHALMLRMQQELCFGPCCCLRSSLRFLLSFSASLPPFFCCSFS